MKKRTDIDTNEVIRLYETEMLSFAEIAKVLGVSVSKIYLSLSDDHRARHQMETYQTHFRPNHFHSVMGVKGV